ncbi:MAG: 4-oxalomesaconate tautomerase [Acidobacteriota bacterium]|nr:4-oxalomesaconate tautomerase [Acidobacteriota bacterium]
MRPGVRCMLMRGGTSKGAYFLADELPAGAAERDDLLLRILGSPDARQIDGIGGAHPLTSKAAIVSRSQSPGIDLDFLFAQVNVTEPLVDTTPNCGNILAGVGPFALERGLLAAHHPQTRIRVRTLNTGTVAELVVQTPQGVVCYEGDTAIDGVPGTAAAIPINFLETAGSVCGSLFPSGARTDAIDGVSVTCIDNGMPVVLLRAQDFGLTGRESCAEIEASAEALRRIESIRLQAGRRMNLGEVADAVVPKMSLLAPPAQGGCIATRTLIPRKCHASIGVFGAVSVATACVLPGTVAYALASPPEGPIKLMEVEHPAGFFQVRLEMGGTREDPTVERSGLVRTARALFDGIAYPRSSATLPGAC